MSCTPGGRAAARWPVLPQPCSWDPKYPAPITSRSSPNKQEAEQEERRQPAMAVPHLRALFLIVRRLSLYDTVYQY